MKHYEKLIIGGLIRKGGSSSETYVYKILTGDMGDFRKPLKQMWDYLDIPLKQLIFEIFNEIFHIKLDGLNENDVLEAITNHMAEKAGIEEFFNYYSREQIELMSDDQYESLKEKFVNNRKMFLKTL